MRPKRDPKMKPKVDVLKYEDYQEKSLKEMLEDSVLVQLILMFVQIALLSFRVLSLLFWDIIDGVFLTLRRIFIHGGELMLMLDYVLPFMYYVKTT